MKVQIMVAYGNDVYSSHVKEFTQEEIDDTKGYLKQIAEGKATYLSVENGEQEYFFSKQILAQSVITIIVTE